MVQVGFWQWMVHLAQVTYEKAIMSESKEHRPLRIAFDILDARRQGGKQQDKKGHRIAICRLDDTEIL